MHQIKNSFEKNLLKFHLLGVRIRPTPVGTYGDGKTILLKIKIQSSQQFLLNTFGRWYQMHSNDRYPHPIQLPLDCS